IWVAGNEYLQIAAPWKTIKEDEAAAAAAVRCAFNLIVLFATLSRPVIPFTSDKMYSVFGISAQDAPAWPGDLDIELNRLKPGEEFAPPDVLFRKVESDEIDEWRKQFGAGDGQ
ncbi:MAG: methionine--tRNA ligase, partial [Pseudomonadota bacterium]